MIHTWQQRFGIAGQGGPPSWTVAPWSDNGVCSSRQPDVVKLHCHCNVTVTPKSFSQGLKMQWSLTRCVSWIPELSRDTASGGLWLANGSRFGSQPFLGWGWLSHWSQEDSQRLLALCLPSLAETREGWGLLHQPCGSGKSKLVFQTAYFYVITFTPLLIMWENNLINFRFKICLRNVPGRKFGMSNTFLWLWFLKVFI